MQKGLKEYSQGHRQLSRPFLHCLNMAEPSHIIRWCFAKGKVTRLLPAFPLNPNALVP